MICVFDGRLDVECATNPQNTFVIDLDLMVTIQIIMDSSVSFGWIVAMDLFYLLGKEFILSNSLSDIIF